jgi:hypothetical protein
VGEDRRLQLADPAARVDAELVAQRSAHLVDRSQGFGLTARPVEGEREMAPQLLPQRMVGDELRQLPDDRRVPAEGEVGGEPVLDRGEASILESCRGATGELLVRELDQGWPAPQCDRLGETFTRLRRGSGVEQLPTLVGEALEAAEVDLLRVDVEPVAGGFPDEGLRLLPAASAGFDRASQAGDVGLQRPRRRARRSFAPHALDQRIDRDDPSGGDEEHRQQMPGLAAADVDSPPVVGNHLQTAEQPETHLSPPGPV